MLQSRLKKWLAVLFISTPVLIWRLVDFAHETQDGIYGMNRIGFLFMGTPAEVVELVIIFICIVLVWISIVNLVRLRRSRSPGDGEKR